MDPKAKRLALFEEAIKGTYGPYTRDPVFWQPPEEPGTGGHRGRFLWTDAFGVVNFITLSREKGDLHSKKLYLELAKQLVETVHSVLGRTRDGTSRLPGATDEEPLKGGLRTGMPDNLDPDIDGQYHHSLTLWMFALNRLSLATGEPPIHPCFIVKRFGLERVVWKISMDMQRKLVDCSGNSNDVVGFFMYQLLQETAEHFSRLGTTNNSPSLDAEIQQYYCIMADHIVSPPNNPLELGMSLWISHFDRSAVWSRNLAEAGLIAVCHCFLPNSVIAGGRSQFRDFFAFLGIKYYLDDPSKPLHLAAEAMLDVWEEWGPTNLAMFAAALIPGAFRKDFFDDLK
ncbi:hypothetical protein F4781DRAFT_445517 [Annulohypoxylon bovei var. microspora]|nr:hypothetical protein F4781DRAFT_445517 [Annulohypoxylon bovei var. microspora]